jgi:hypothetical protein
MLDFDPTMLNDACDLGVKTRVTSSGTCPWGENDLVHLTPEGYKDLVLAIREHTHGEMAGMALAWPALTYLAKRDVPRSLLLLGRLPHHQREAGGQSHLELPAGW